MSFHSLCCITCSASSSIVPGSTLRKKFELGYLCKVVPIWVQDGDDCGWSWLDCRARTAHTNNKCALVNITLGLTKCHWIYGLSVSTLRRRSLSHWTFGRKLQGFFFFFLGPNFPFLRWAWSGQAPLPLHGIKTLKSEGAARVSATDASTFEVNHWHCK